MSKTFCPLPWIHLATRPNGDVRVCCTANASGAGLEDDKDQKTVADDEADDEAECVTLNDLAD